MADPTVRLLGIRHLGPGSARSVLEALTEMEPDCILVEGPPEGHRVLPLLVHEQMKPPVAMLIYSPDNPGKAVYYPFAVFSPEWQALSFGLKKHIPVRFMDLPQSNWLALSEDEPETAAPDSESDTVDDPGEIGNNEQEDSETDRGANHQHADEVSEHEDDLLAHLHEHSDGEKLDALSIRRDPLSWLARAAGYSDGERWWEHLVEQRRDNREVFQAINEAMTTLRKELPEQRPDRMEPLREAHMRQTIRSAQKEDFKKIAVICGAWHVPALDEMPPAREDAATLKGLPKIKVDATWIPWTNSRLTYASGYGAGVTSPGWYHHLWTSNGLVAERWMARVARLLREEDLDASSASVIESVRLAECLAALRGRPLAGLEEMMEASKSVFCLGSDVPLRMIQHKLIVGEVLGEIPEQTPSIPLQKDIEKEQKRLRLPADAGEMVKDLDLRAENDLARSHLLHRMELLGIRWGLVEKTTGKKGTFHEVWRIRWQPEFSLLIIEAARWGKTVAEAATAFSTHKADETHSLPELTQLLDKSLWCNLPVEHIMQRVENEAAIADDITHLMGAVPPLSEIARYGNVRKTDTSAVSHIINGLVARVATGMSAACASLNDEAASAMFEHIIALNSALSLLQNDELTALWHDSLGRLANDFGIHGLVSGRACRILKDAGTISAEEAATRIGLALSRATDPGQAANWAEGFLRGSGLVLIHDEALFAVIDEWVSALSDDTFTTVLPLLRRTFSTFTRPERRQMGERLVSGPRKHRTPVPQSDFDQSRADAVLPVISKCLGLS